MSSFIQFLSGFALLATVLYRGCLSKKRGYFIAAVEMDWNYAPTGFNNLNGVPLEDDR